MQPFVTVLSIRNLCLIFSCFVFSCHMWVSSLYSCHDDGARWPMFNYVAVPFVQNSKYFFKNCWKFAMWFILPSSVHTVVVLRCKSINIRCIAIKHLQFANVFKICHSIVLCWSHLKGYICLLLWKVSVASFTHLTPERYHHFPESVSETGVTYSTPFHVTILVMPCQSQLALPDSVTAYPLPIYPSSLDCPRASMIWKAVEMS